MTDMKDVERNLYITGGVLIFLATMLLIYALVTIFLGQIPVETKYEPTKYQQEEIKRLHKKHGVSLSIDNAGYRYFIRNGKVCELK